MHFYELFSTCLAHIQFPFDINLSKWIDRLPQNLIQFNSLLAASCLPGTVPQLTAFRRLYSLIQQLGLLFSNHRFCWH